MKEAIQEFITLAFLALVFVLALIVLPSCSSHPDARVHPVSAQGSDGTTNIGLVPTMKTPWEH